MQEILLEVVPIKDFETLFAPADLGEKLPHAIMPITQAHEWVTQGLAVHPTLAGKDCSQNAAPRVNACNARAFVLQPIAGLSFLLTTQTHFPSIKTHLSYLLLSVG